MSIEGKGEIPAKEKACVNSCIDADGSGRQPKHGTGSDNESRRTKGSNLSASRTNCWELFGCFSICLGTNHSIAGNKKLELTDRNKRASNPDVKAKDQPDTKN